MKRIPLMVSILLAGLLACLSPVMAQQSSLSERRVQKTTSPAIPSVSGNSLETLVNNSSVPVLVLFTGSGCIGCDEVEFALSTLVREYAFQVTMYKIDLDSEAVAVQGSFFSVILIIDPGTATGITITGVPESSAHMKDLLESALLILEQAAHSKPSGDN